ncbi:MAG: hypothetical protein JJ909_10910 [Roseivirga sp.]|nr:hypothetical protein [Roseivirga sp.]
MNQIRKNNSVARVLIIGLLLVLNGSLIAQKNFMEIAQMKDKKWDNFRKGSDYYISQLMLIDGLIDVGLLKEENTPNPKDIGVLTFQLWDESTWKSSKAGGWVYYEKNFISEDGSNMISNRIMEEILPKIRAKYTSAGFNLMEPDEFITKEEQKNGLLNRLQGNSNGGTGSVSADGYAFYPVTAKTVSMDFKSPSNIGLITEELGLDASLLIAVRVSIEKGGRSLVFRGFEMAVVTTIDDEKDKEYSGRIGAKLMNMYRDGLTMSASYFQMDPIMLADLERKTGNVEKWYLDGVDLVAERMTDDVIFGMKKFINRDKSRK